MISCSRSLLVIADGQIAVVVVHAIDVVQVEDAVLRAAKDLQTQTAALVAFWEDRMQTVVLVVFEDHPTAALHAIEDLPGAIAVTEDLQTVAIVAIEDHLTDATVATKDDRMQTAAINAVVEVHFAAIIAGNFPG